MELEKINIDGKEFSPSIIINYSSLIELFTVLAKKCNTLESKLNSIDKRLSNVEISLNINSDQPNYYPDSETKTRKDNLSNSLYILTEKKEKEKENINRKEKLELNYTIFSELYKKVKDHDKLIKTVFNTVNTNKKNDDDKYEEIKNKIDLINTNLNNEIKKSDSFIKKINEKVVHYDDDIELLKDKLKDFNIYDIFKFQNIGPDIDENFMKYLINNLEAKINRKLSIYDEKIKSINKDIFKIQDEEKNHNACISGYNMSVERIIKLREELNQKYNDLSNALNDNMSEVNKKIEFFDSKIKVLDSISNMNEEKYNEFKKKEKRLNEMINKSLNSSSNERMNTSFLNEETINKVIKRLKDDLNQLDNYCKNNFNEINITEINKRIIALEKNKNYLLYEEELHNINENNKSYNYKIKEFTNKFESVFQEIETSKEEITELKKKLNLLNNDSEKFTSKGIHNVVESKLNNIDLNKFISSSAFNDNKKENMTKFEKIIKKLEELEFSIDHILDKLTHTPSDVDFSQFQEIIKNMIENIVLKNKKQFANKLETAKSYKLLETKLNTINDSYNKKITGADNWLLAKKPLNSFQCASCESIIKGDLDQKGEYIAWNKYPFRDDNKSSYRMGHGFSHMLNMINEGLMKDTGEYIKDEDNKKGKKEENNLFFDKNKKNNFDDLSIEMLPKVKKKSNIYNLSIGFESPIHNSRDLKNINKTIDNQENTPQIIKIFKKNRSTIFKTDINNNIQSGKQKNVEIIKYLNFNPNNKETE